MLTGRKRAGANQVELPGLRPQQARTNREQDILNRALGGQNW
jgi:hypothetical protein